MYVSGPKPCLLKPQAVSTQIPNDPPISNPNHIGSTPSRVYSNPSHIGSTPSRVYSNP